MTSTRVQTQSGVYMSTPTRVQADESLSCGGCRLRFDAIQRRPLVLQCLHSFCETCIRSFAGSKHNKKVTCSLCRTTTKLNGKNLPINHNILEMIHASGRTPPVTVITKAGSGQQVHPCSSGPSGQYSGDRVTVIPVHKKDQDADQQQQQLGISTYDVCDDSRQSNGTTSINVGQTRKTKDGHVTTTTSSITSLPVSSEATGSRSLSVVVTMSSPSSGCGPSGSSYTAAPHLTQPASGSCPTSQAVMSCMAPGLTSTVTSLTVNATSHPAALSHGTIGSSNDTPIQSSVDLCCQCRVHPAMLTVTSATEMSSQKLCSNCHSLIQQQKLDGEIENPTRNQVPLRRNTQNAGCGGSDVPSTTVIKVLDEHNTGGGSGGGGNGGSAGSAGSGCACSTASQSAIVKCLAPPMPPCVSEEGHRGSIHVDGRRTGGPQPPPAQKTFEVNDARPTANVLIERSAEGIQRPSLKPTYVSCSKFNLRAEVPDAKRLVERLNINPPSNADDTESTDVDDISNEEIYRPLPFNPNFADNHGPVPLLEHQPPLPSAGEALYPALPNEKQGLDFQGAAMHGGPVYPYPAQSPPRYEEIASQGAAPPTEAPHLAHSASVQCVSAFGKYGELATQPGAFRSPTRINASRGGGVVVVTDSAHRTVQAFNASTGECLALIRVSGDSANGCSCYDKKKLTVGTNSGIQIYDFNGTLKKTIPIGAVINTVSALRGQGFIAVQPKSLSIFRGPSETLVRTLKDRSKPGPVRQPVPFDCIADAAVNSQEDIVVLDAGAASGLGMILIMSDDGYLKSCIVPGREPCGVLRQPQAVAVDKAHNIIVSDSANRRVLLFAANGKFHRQLIGPGHDPKTWPVGLDIGDDGRMFVVAKGEKFAEVRVFSYQ